MSILVTGGAGFIGSFVTGALLQRDERVVVYDLSPAGNSLDQILDGRAPGLTVERGAMADGWRLLEVCRRHDVDRIIHLASPLTQDVYQDPATGIRDICLGTASIFEIAKVASVSRVVWASSSAVFGRRSDYPAGPIANDAPHRPESLYGSCKSLCEHMALDYRARDGVSSVALRLSVVYGPGRLRGYMTFPVDIIRRVALGVPVEIPIADQPIHWQFVEDVAGLFIAALDGPDPSSIAFNPVGHTGTFRDAAEVLSGLAPDVTISLSTAATEPGHTALLQAPAEYDDAPAIAQLGYLPRFSLEEGIEATYRHFRRLAESGVGVT